MKKIEKKNGSEFSQSYNSYDAVPTLSSLLFQW